MYTVSATQLKTRLGDALARAATERVAIERHGKVVAYLVPAEVPTAAPAPAPSAPRKGRSLSRAEEARLLDLCASGDFRPSRWLRAGDRYLLGGVAALLGSVDLFDRTRMFALAERLQPGMSTIDVYRKWLRSGIVRPDRFLPMLRARLAARSGHA